MDKEQRVKDLAETLLAIELLEYHDMNFLAGSPKLLNQKKREVINEIIILATQLKINSNIEIQKQKHKGVF
jgi:hypothetical protein